LMLLNFLFSSLHIVFFHGQHGIKQACLLKYTTANATNIQVLSNRWAKTITLTNFSNLKSIFAFHDALYHNNP